MGGLLVCLTLFAPQPRVFVALSRRHGPQRMDSQCQHGRRSLLCGQTISARWLRSSPSMQQLCLNQVVPAFARLIALIYATAIQTTCSALLASSEIWLPRRLQFLPSRLSAWDCSPTCRLPWLLVWVSMHILPTLSSDTTDPALFHTKSLSQQSLSRGSSSSA